MSADPTRIEALRSAGFAALVDTEDPPGKVTVVFDLTDFDEMIMQLVHGAPVDVDQARREGYAQGRSDAEAVVSSNARRALAAELVADAGKGGTALAEKVDELARQHNIPKGPRAPLDPGMRAALVGDGPASGWQAKGRLRTPATERPEDHDQIQPAEEGRR